MKLTLPRSPAVWLSIAACALCVGAAALCIAAGAMMSSALEQQQALAARAAKGECRPASDKARTSAGADAPAAIAPKPKRTGPAAPPVPGTLDDLSSLGQSLGAPRRGALYGGRKIESGEGYWVRNPERAYATDATIDHLEAVFEQIRPETRKVHKLVVGDLSWQVGGFLPGHFSHQSGRDVDLGLFYRVRPPGFPGRSVDGTKDNLHYQATLTLLMALADTADSETGVEWILLDYRLQRLLYKYARRQGIDTSELDVLFQFPRKPTTREGIVRHFPGHANHMHVRFKCPPDSPTCVPTVNGPPQTWSGEDGENMGALPGAPPPETTKATASPSTTGTSVE